MSQQSADHKKEGENKTNDKQGVYFNGFNIHNTLVDFQLDISLNGTQIESYNMAPVTAKNLALQLLSVVDKYESLTGTHIDAFNDLKERTQDKMKKNEELKKETEKRDKELKKQEEKEKEKDNNKPTA